VRRKLGLISSEVADESLAKNLLRLLTEHKLDFTNSWRELAETGAMAASQDSSGLRDWQDRLGARRTRDGHNAAAARTLMLSASPAVIPRNHQVEAALDAARLHGDYSPTERLLAALQDPFVTRDDRVEYQRPPRPDEVVQATFCGT